MDNPQSLTFNFNNNHYRNAGIVYENVEKEFRQNTRMSDYDICKMREYYQNLLDPKKSTFFKHNFALRLAFFLDHIGQLKKGSTILDIACGMGTQAILYGLLGYKVTAIDMDSTNVSIAKQRTKFYSEISNKTDN